jgi:hypothetical protein
MACIANDAMPDRWEHENGGARYGSAIELVDELGIRHAFVRGRTVSHRGWWKCDFAYSAGLAGWVRNWHPHWDP